MLTPPEPFDLVSTVGLLQRGGFDPTTRVFAKGELWRASMTPAGRAALAVRTEAGRLRARAWGPGAGWMLDAVPALLGFDDDPSGFDPPEGPIRDLHRRHRGLRLGRTGRVIEALVPSIIEQKVTGREAFRSFERLVRRYGEPAPGPLGLMIAPAPERIAAMPYWAFHPLGIERRRADTVRRAAARASRLEEITSMAIADAHTRLRAIVGIGRWTAAEVARVALGDPDAVSVGDYHLKNVVTYALTGRPRGTDEEMLELLEPYRGQRARAVRLLELGGPRPPRFGPRVALRKLERI
jgi:3-methyladenine DNA glycosylase/8-oxoguanine DNA glycosylase